MFKRLKVEFESSPSAQPPSWRNSTGSDWKIVVGPKDYNVHKVFLMFEPGTSHVIKTQIERWSRGDSSTILTDLLPEATWDTFELVLDYAYGENIDLNDRNVAPLLKISQILQIRGLGAKCVTYLEELLAAGDCVDSKKWDREKSSRTGVIIYGTVDDIDTIAAKTSATGWNTSVIATTMANTFTVNVTSANNSMVGFVDGSLYRNTDRNFNSGYFLYCSNGTLYSRQRNRVGYLNRSILVDEMVQATYDAEAGTISFSVGVEGEMRDHGVAFSNVTATGGLWPCVDFHDQHASIQLNSNIDLLQTRKKINSVITITSFAMQLSPGLEDIINACVSILAANFDRINNDSFLAGLPKNILQAVLLHDNLNVFDNAVLISHVVRCHIDKNASLLNSGDFTQLVEHVNEIGPKDSIPLLIRAVAFGDKCLQRKCVDSLAFRFRKMTNFSLLQEIPSHALVVALLNSDNLAIKHEDQVFDAIVDYTQKKTELSTEQLGEIWSTCRFAFISSARHFQIAENFHEVIPCKWINLGSAINKLKHNDASKRNELIKKYGSRLCRRQKIIGWNLEKSTTFGVTITSTDYSNDTIATKTLAKGWSTSVIANTMANTFTVKVVSGTNSWIGFVDGSSYRNTDRNFDHSGYFVYCCDGRICSRNHIHRYLNRGIDVNEMVQATYDAEAGTISFSVGVEGKMRDHGVAFRSVPATGGLWPCVDLYNQQASVELIDIE